MGQVELNYKIYILYILTVIFLYYYNIMYNNNSQVWYTHYRGYIIKSWIDKNTNRILQEKIPYNQPRINKL